jgi:hypothetical protein
MVRITDLVDGQSHARQKLLQSDTRSPHAIGSKSRQPALRRWQAGQLLDRLLRRASLHRSATRSLAENNKKRLGLQIASKPAVGVSRRARPYRDELAIHAYRAEDDRRFTSIGLRPQARLLEYNPRPQMPGCVCSIRSRSVAWPTR